MATAAAIGPTGPRVHHQRGGGARLTRTLVILVGVALAAALVVAIVALHSDSPETSSTVRSGDAAAVTSNEARAAIAELEAKARRPRAAEFKPAPVLPSLPKVATQAPAAPLAARPPSRLAELQEEEYVKALSAPPMVGAFHHGETLEVPTLAGQTGTSGPDNFMSPQITQTGATGVVASLKPPSSPYLITAGSVIPAVLISGINSELPGPILAQVRENVFDTATGRWVLIPQGSKLIGAYKTDAAYGQQRVQIGWKRMIFPNASSMDIPEMPGADDAGYAGFSDQVNNHYLKTYGTAALLSVISAGQMVGQMGAFGGGMGFSGPYGYGYATPNQMSLLSEMGGAAASQQLGQVAQGSLQRGMNIPPTLEIRPGYQFNVMVTNDLVLPGPYRN
jgi:type IV secretory pathway VirB10-like protein